jgi:hypothetical protein
MSFLKVRDQRRGRPIGSGHLKKPEHKSSIPTRITPELRDFLESERTANETMADTIFRLIRQTRQEKIVLRKKVDALQERLDILTSLPIRGGS